MVFVESKPTEKYFSSGLKFSDLHVPRFTEKISEINIVVYMCGQNFNSKVQMAKMCCNLSPLEKLQ